MLGPERCFPQMLPALYYDRLTHAVDARTDVRGTERRRAIRIPARFRPQLYPISCGVLLAPWRVRTRDISTCGVGLLVSVDLPITQAAVIAIRPRNQQERFVMLCALRRLTKVDNNWQIAGFSFERVLSPGQSLETDDQVSSFHWTDVSGETTPDDPLYDPSSVGVPEHWGAAAD